MRRIHKVVAVCGSAALLGIAVTPAALASGGIRAASGGVRVVAGAAAGIPNSNIKGKPAHWSPSSLSAKAKWTGTNPCPTSQTSFTMTNTESKAEKVTLSGPGLKSASGTIPAGKRFGACVAKGYTRTAHVTLSDGKKLTVNF